jgi:hypothetical protein
MSVPAGQNRLITGAFFYKWEWEGKVEFDEVVEGCCEPDLTGFAEHSVRLNLSGLKELVEGCYRAKLRSS